MCQNRAVSKPPLHDVGMLLQPSSQAQLPSQLNLPRMSHWSQAQDVVHLLFKQGQRNKKQRAINIFSKRNSWKFKPPYAAVADIAAAGTSLLAGIVTPSRAARRTTCNQNL